MFNLHNEILDDFDTSRELVSVNYRVDFDNYFDALTKSSTYYESVKNQTLITRKKNELHFHNFLEHQLFSRLQEIKYYSEVNIADTRRLVSVSSDCISTIQILVRDKIHVNVYFRSSDFDGALPADLEFICNLPYKLIRHLSIMSEAKGYEDINNLLMEKIINSKVQINLMFGSLHRTNKEEDEN